MGTELGEQRVGSEGLEETLQVTVDGEAEGIPSRGNTVYLGIMDHGSRVGFGEESRLEMRLGAPSLKATIAWVQEYFFILKSYRQSPRFGHW